mgnify:CR=1 FL=1
MRLYTGLIHFPVYNRNSQKIASSITTLDIHDLARLARTYSIEGLFIVTPLEDQQEIAAEIVRHWLKGYGARYNKDRKEAIHLVAVVQSMEQVVAAVKKKEGQTPLIIATDAGERSHRSLSYSGARKIIEEDTVVLLLFGTAWGLHDELLETVDYVLAPITGRTGYNHLSVRAAAAIIIDRLAGRETE